MDAEVWAALLTAIASLLVAAMSAWFAREGDRRSRMMAERQHEMQQELTTLTAEQARLTQREERMASAREQLDRHRDPLLAAALDLAHRINNIRNDWFLDTYMVRNDDRRQQIARTSTLYRFARYWAVVESLYDDVAMQSFELEDQTRQVAGTLRDIGRTFASDRYDDKRFMMWREEQRAVAELMRSDRGDGHIGYATFVDQYDRKFGPWFESFASSLSPGFARESERFARTQGLLAELVRQLDLRDTYRGQWEALKANAPEFRAADADR